MTPELQALVQRLEEVEKQISHLASLVVAQSDRDREVVARGFVVRDTDGKERATLGMDEGGPLLALFDANGNARAGVGLTSEGSFVVLYDANGKCRARLEVDGRRGPWLGFYDAEGLLRLDALVLDGHGPMLFLRDKATNPRVSALVLEYPSVSLQDANNKRHISIEIFPSGTPALFMGGGPNPELATVGPILKLAIEGDRPCLLFGRDNKVFWSAP